MAARNKSKVFQIVALALAMAQPATSLAQSYPSKSIRWIVPSGPGDGSDTTGRVTQPRDTFGAQREAPDHR